MLRRYYGRVCRVGEESLSLLRARDVSMTEGEESSIGGVAMSCV